MKRISSFAVNHDILQEGMYLSRVDGDVITYDIRMKKPNGGDYLPNAAIHSFEHLFATFARNSEFSQSVIYVGPMGCRTGFYLLVRDRLSHEDALILVKKAFVFIANFQGEIPGSQPFECGNYKEHNLHGAKEMARDMIVVLEGWSKEKMNYEESKM
ncbi:S-ribosylhomocysteine lyase [Anaerotignum sp. MB30-C6]|uniref:S-ribosylhomocysteine lyase n=1 Tax=Anaerotignum sp. MB30-C6 TaxID=3070814 RepID=UPI0027DB4E8A|nr:S-ribosylhomocysteine lyase [Anaerotignum sp. MB30-C6]WMI80060.1 S-ribosylhomocysteine lyase [Anaerotignum sp. MB30-C6]